VEGVGGEVAVVLVGGDDEGGELDGILLGGPAWAAGGTRGEALRVRRAEGEGGQGEPVPRRRGRRVMIHVV